MSRLQEKSPAADRVVRKSRRYFDLAKEHKAARETERHTLLLEGDDLKAWCDRTREMKSTEIGLAYSNPKSVEGAFEMLRLSALRLRLGMVSRKQPSTSSSGNSVFCRKATTTASSAGVSTVLLGDFGPIDASAVVVRSRHFATVFGFRP